MVNFAAGMLAIMHNTSLKSCANLRNKFHLTITYIKIIINNHHFLL